MESLTEATVPPEEKPQCGETVAEEEVLQCASEETASPHCRVHGAPHPFNAKSFSFNEADALAKETSRLLSEPCLCHASLPRASTPPQQLPPPREQERWEDPLKARRKALENRRALEGPDPKLSLAISQLKMKHKCVQHEVQLLGASEAQLLRHAYSTAALRAANRKPAYRSRGISQAPASSKKKEASRKLEGQDALAALRALTADLRESLAQLSIDFTEGIAGPLAASEGGGRRMSSVASSAVVGATSGTAASANGSDVTGVCATSGEDPAMLGWPFTEDEAGAAGGDGSGGFVEFLAANNVLETFRDILVEGDRVAVNTHQRVEAALILKALLHRYLKEQQRQAEAPTRSTSRRRRF